MIPKIINNPNQELDNALRLSLSIKTALDDSTAESKTGVVNGKYSNGYRICFDPERMVMVVRRTPKAAIPASAVMAMVINGVLSMETPLFA